MKQSGSEASPAPHSKHLRWAKVVLTLALFIVIPILLYYQLRNIEWDEVTSTLRNFPVWALLACVVVTALSYLTYACYDVLGRFYTKHSLPIRQILPVVFVCYAFNLNLSSLVGGVALRYRLYGRLGLDNATVTRLLSLSLVTNWLGYLWLAGAVFSLGVVSLPEGWGIGSTSLRVIGGAMILISIAYILACALSTKRSWTIKGHTIELPSATLTLLQAGLGTLNWALMATAIWLLLPAEASYPTILAILLISSIAGAIAHVPAGLGVLEMIFLTLLQDQFSKGTILAALIGYRAIYFLLPLSVAIVVYLVLEKRAKTMRSDNAEEQASSGH